MKDCKDCLYCLRYSSKTAGCINTGKWKHRTEAETCNEYVEYYEKEFDEMMAEMAEFYEMESNDE